MDFTAKIKDYISNENELEPFKEKQNELQMNVDRCLEANKGSYGEYSIDVFEDLMIQQKELESIQETLQIMNKRNLYLKNDILHHLELLKGGKLIVSIHNTSYLISKDGDKIHLDTGFGMQLLPQVNGAGQLV